MKTSTGSICKLLMIGCILITQPACSQQTKQIKKAPQAPAATQKVAQHKTPQTTQLTIKNNITPSMLAYTYLFIKYTPSLFTVKINGQLIEPGQEKTITVTDNKITVQYYFEFSTHRSGKREAEYTIKDTHKPASLTFNWKKKVRISIDGAQPAWTEDRTVA